MKKGFLLICMLLAMLAATPSLAQTTGIAMDGKVYTFVGSDGVYTADGITFVIGENDVTVIRADGSVSHLPLTHTEDDSTVTVVPGTNSVTYITYGENSGIAVDYEETNTVTTVVEDVAPLLQQGTGTTHFIEANPIAASKEASVVYGKATNQSNAEEFSLYAKYGLSYDVTGNKLYYQGKRVRVMEDEMKLDASMLSALQWFDETGEIDVRAIRDGAGILTGIEALSETQFAARDLSAWMEPNVTRTEMTATSGRALTPEERVAFFAPYVDFGLRYDVARDLLFYGNKQVRNLVDIRKSNGEKPGSGKFSGELTQLVYDGGEVDVTAIRDYEHPDAEGNGKLLGLNVEEAK